MKTVGLKKKIFELSFSNQLNFREISPRNEEQNRDDESDQKSQIDVEKDCAEKRRNPDERFRVRSFCVTTQIAELNENSEKGNDDDWRQNGLKTKKYYPIVEVDILTSLIEKNYCIFFNFMINQNLRQILPV